MLMQESLKLKSCERERCNITPGGEDSGLKTTIFQSVIWTKTLKNLNFMSTFLHHSHARVKNLSPSENKIPIGLLRSIP